MIIAITGATSGIGSETAKYLAQHGHFVYSLSRRVFANQENITYLPCDVTDVETIKEALNVIIKEQGKLDVLINNAGMGISGAIEYNSAEAIDKIIDVNIKGVINVTKEALPYLRETKGKIINIGSVAGELAIPFQTMYSLTKSAITVFSEGLNNELRPFKTKVTTVLPGDTKTDFTVNRVKEEPSSLYQDRVNRSVKKMEKDEQNGVSPLKVAKVILKCIKRKKPPLKVTVGFTYKLFVFLKRILPSRLVNYIIYKIYG